MQFIQQGSYSEKEVLQYLMSNRIIRFEYHLLDSNDNFIKKLDTVISCSIRFDSLAQIKRTARLQLKDDNEINYLAHRVQPWIVFVLPNGDELKWSQGIFLLNSPTENISNDYVTRDIECYDKLQILMDDKVTERFTIIENSNYTIEINKIITGIGETNIDITSSSQTLSRALEFEIGTSKLEIINKLLDDLNYHSLIVDENGIFKSEPYILPIDRTVEFTYEDDKYSVYLDNIDSELDLFNVPNKFVAYVSNPEQTPLIATYTNDNPNSLTSTVNRSRTITQVESLDDIADQTALNNYVRMLAYNANKVYGKLKFRTCIMPFHSYNDTYRFIYSDKVDDIYNETNWSLDMRVGGEMIHEARRVVEI